MFKTILPLLRTTGSSRQSICQLQMRRSASSSPQQATWASPVGDTVRIAYKPIDNIGTAEEIWARRSSQALNDLSKNPQVDAYTGRTVLVKDGNVAESYAVLHRILQRNKVRAQLRRAERHEQKGEKRRRLNSERWRRQFAHEVRMKVQLVQKIRDRGA